MKRAINDASVVNLTELSQATGRGLSTIYRDIERGYEPEFGRRGTTIGHYKGWMRAVKATDAEPILLPEAQARLEQEMCALTASADQSAQERRPHRQRSV